MSAKGGGAPPEPPNLSSPEVVALWAKWRAGDVVPCPRDGMSVALAVDGAAKSYRLVCVQCGLASPWFGTTPSGLVFRNTGGATLPGGGPLDE